MSSFVISKSEYVKVGAFIGAFTEIRRRGDTLLYLYNVEEGRLYNSVDVINEMISIYKMNVDSVNEQYNESSDYDESDSNQFEIAKYMAYAKKVLNDENKLESAIANIHQFFRSVNYQIENEELNEKAKKIMSKYECALVGILMETKGVETDSWGDFNIAD